MLSFTTPFFRQINADYSFELLFLSVLLDETTASLVTDSPVVCLFVNDQANAEAIRKLKERGVEPIALRCAGFNNVGLEACQQHRIRVVRVPAYSSYSVAEHTIALILTLNRKTHRAYNRVKEGNFALDGLMGFDLHGRTAGLLGLDQIGKVTAQILKGFGCRVLAYDLMENEHVG